MSSLLPDVTDPRGYPFWLLAISLLVFVLERVVPWRRSQRALRPQIGQDLFWLVFNGHYAGVVIGWFASLLIGALARQHEALESVHLLASRSLWVQFAVCFVVKDLVEYGVHNLLHRVPWLWEFHKVHHSIEQLDWIGNFRFHWMEIVVYRGLTYVPLTVLGVDSRVVLAIAVVSTLIGDLNDANLRISWGPLRYLINSPRMHVWHHDRDWPPDHPRGVNFGISLSLWDWLFRTAWWPEPASAPTQQPGRLGFAGMERFPRSWLDRFALPISRLWSRADAAR